MDQTEDSLKAAEEVTVQEIAYRSGNPTRMMKDDGTRVLTAGVSRSLEVCLPGLGMRRTAASRLAERLLLYH